MVKSTKLAEFRIERSRLIDALMHISNITAKASIALIVGKEEGNTTKMGINFNNVALFDESGHQFDLYSAYPIFNDEMTCRNYFIETVTDWPVFFIACTPEFIRSIITLPPIVTSNEVEVLALALWNIKDGDKTKSNAVIFGDHHSHIASIIEHSGLAVGTGGTITQSSSDDEIEEPTGLG
jgi:hypothetical protein